MGFLESAGFVMLSPYIRAVLIAAIGAIVIKLVCKALSALLARAKGNHLIDNFVMKVVRIVLWVFVIMMVLGALGIDSSSVIAVIAAAGAAIALALQDSLSNLASGLLLMLSGTFVKGDYINANGVDGTVESIDLFYTTVITVDGKIVTIPNGSMTTGNITNYTKHGTRRLDIPITVAMDSDLEKVLSALTELAKEDERVLDRPEPFAAVDSYTDNGIKVFLRVFCESSDFLELRFALHNKLKPRLDKEGIKVPFAQIDVHMK
jgi:small conductance mechanosensitive channel